MTTTDLFGYLSYALIIIGLWLIGKQHRWGWFIKGIGDFGWVCVGYQVGLSSIWLPEVAFVVMDGYYFYKWRNLGAETPKESTDESGES